MKLDVLTPAVLEDLFPVFAALERGDSFALVPANSGPLELLPPSELGLSGKPCLGVTSSGSTGRPKLVWKEWDDLKRDSVQADSWRGWTWATPFDPWTFAGVQVALQAWASGGKAITLTRDWDPMWRLLAGQKVQALSSTPTYLDLLIQMEGPVSHPVDLRQITLGGELLRPTLEKRFRERFPAARFTVIYAKAELGVLFKTHRLDGWYELDSLATRWPDWKLEPIQEQTTNLESPATGILVLPQFSRKEAAPAVDWMSTGDLVQIQNDLIRVLGRADAVANVAGTKINLDEVARTAETVPGVRMASATALANAVTGEVVALRIQAEPGFDSGELEQRVAAHLRSLLRKEAWPRRWEFGGMELGPNSKAKTR